MFTGVAPDYPGQIITGKVERTRFLNAVLELLEMAPVIELPGSWIPRKTVVCHLGKLGRPLGVIRYLVVEEESGTEEGLHLFLGNWKMKCLDRLFAGLGQLPLTFADLVTEKGHLLVADEGFLDLQDNTEFTAAGDNPFKLITRHGGAFAPPCT